MCAKVHEAVGGQPSGVRAHRPPGPGRLSRVVYADQPLLPGGLCQASLHRSAGIADVCHTAGLLM